MLKESIKNKIIGKLNEMSNDITDGINIDNSNVINAKDCTQVLFASPIKRSVNDGKFILIFENEPSKEYPYNTISSIDPTTFFVIKDKTITVFLHAEKLLNNIKEMVNKIEGERNEN